MSDPGANVSERGVTDPVSRELEALVARYADRVRQASARHGLRDSEIDDIFQDVRIRLWRALADGGKIAGTPASYVYRTAVSAAIDLLRRRRARREDQVDLDRPSGEAVLGASPPADRPAEEEEFMRLVEQEIEQLADDRAVAVRMHLSGYSREEIASLLGWSEPRTRHLIYRGLNQLRARLLGRGIQPEAIE